MSLDNNRDWLKPIDVLQILIATFFTVMYIYFIVYTDYLDSWYLKIGVGIASIGALIGGIVHWRKTHK
jgi:hypothetical protein